MTQNWAFDLVSVGVFICLMIHALESLYLTKQRGLPPVLPCLLTISAALLIWLPSLPIGGPLALLTLLLAHIKPRWALTNGGSDSLLFILVFGLSLGALFPQATSQHAILVFIASISVWTYFRAGWVKLIAPSWRSGEMLTWSFSSSGFESSPPKLIFPAHIASWLVIGFEISALLVFVIPDYVYLFCFLGFLFHLFNFYSLGLNRFFWTWLATYPALIYTVTHI